VIFSTAMSQKKKSPVDEEMEPASLLEYFAAIPDPRIERSRLHPLQSILTLVLLAVICGADSFVGVEEFGLGKEAWLRTFLDLPHGIPSHDTIGRVFAMLNPQTLAEAFRGWMAAVAGLCHGLVALDGKTLRRSFRQPGVGFIHMVSAWSAQNRVVLGQVKTEEKSNEITAIPRLLELLNLRGCRVSIDAMGCQKDIAAKIVEGGADYLLAVKDNQPTLAAELAGVFAEARRDPQVLASMDFATTRDKGHGRMEERRCWTTNLVDRVSQREQWKELHTLVLIESERTVSGKTTLEQRYYISSMPVLSAKAAMSDVRSHWGIENGLHWVLDVAFREDECRVRAGHAGENFAVVRHLAINLLKSVKGSKVGIQNRRLRAAIDESFLLRVLSALS
jgi:predicted transposase YbfD/YdcC